MKVRSKQLSKEEKMKTLDALYTAAGALKGRDAMKTFLRDLLTESERIMLGRRILIAQMLLCGVPHDEIAAELRVGLDTIYRVQRWLGDQMPGYETAIARMEEEFEERAEKRRVGRMYNDQSWSGVLARLKKRYPLHFLLFPWPSEYKPGQEAKTFETAKRQSHNRRRRQ